MLGSLGITQGHFVYLFLDFKFNRVFVWMRKIFKMLLVWMRIFLLRIKNAFSKISGYVWMGPKWWVIWPNKIFSSKCKSMNPSFSLEFAHFASFQISGKASKAPLCNSRKSCKATYSVGIWPALENMLRQIPLVWSNIKNNREEQKVYSPASVKHRLTG